MDIKKLQQNLTICESLNSYKSIKRDFYSEYLPFGMFNPEIKKALSTINHIACDGEFIEVAKQLNEITYN